jgi:predicted enzyme related to lactoylglutathione lyase
MAPLAKVKLGRIILYVKNMEGTVSFYERHFGFKAQRNPADRIIELDPSNGGAMIMLHSASAKQKQGQSVVKLVFDVDDVAAFVTDAAKNGLKFGALHQADGYVFANAKDPNGNSVSLSSRASRKAH